MSDSTDQVRAYTVRLELVDRPGELLRALGPVADHGGNLLSIFHERGNVTPRGHIPVEVDLEATPDRFEQIVESLREEDINVIEAGAEQYGEELTLVLIGDLVETDLSDTLDRIEAASEGSVRDFSLSVSDHEPASSARVRLAAHRGEVHQTLATVREVAAEKDLQVVAPLAGGDGA